MADDEIDMDAIRKLPPRERMKALRAIQERKKKELEEIEKKYQDDFDETQEAVKKSLDDLTEEEEHEQKKTLEALEHELESLEDAVEEEQAQAYPEQQGYKIAQEQAYTPIQTIVDDLQNLQYKNDWSSPEQELYNQRKEELQKTEQYKNTLSETIVDQLDTAKHILDQMGYRR